MISSQTEVWNTAEKEIVVLLPTLPSSKYSRKFVCQRTKSVEARHTTITKFSTGFFFPVHYKIVIKTYSSSPLNFLFLHFLFSPVLFLSSH